MGAEEGVDGPMTSHSLHAGSTPTPSLTLPIEMCRISDTHTTDISCVYSYSTGRLYSRLRATSDNSAFHPYGGGKCGPASTGEAKGKGSFYSWTDAWWPVKPCDPLTTRATPTRFRNEGVP